MPDLIRFVYICFFCTLNITIYNNLLIRKSVSINRYFLWLSLFILLLLCTKSFYECLANSAFYVTKGKFLLLLFFSFSLILLKIIDNDYSFLKKLNEISGKKLDTIKLINLNNAFINLMVSIFQILLIFNEKLLAQI